MHKSTYIFPACLMLSAVLFPSQAAIADVAAANLRADIANGEKIYQEGKGEVMACAPCHGENALGMDAMESPRLAHIGQVYVQKQLDDYAARIRDDGDKDSMMIGIAKAMSPQEGLDVAAYLDSLEYETEPTDLKALAADGIKIGNPKKGKAIMNEGIKPNVPACRNCHGLSGRSENIAAIHQQKYVYLVNQMKRYRDGSRANDKIVGKYGIMRGISKTLTDEDIADIAAYLTIANSLDE